MKWNSVNFFFGMFFCIAPTPKQNEFKHQDYQLYSTKRLNGFCLPMDWGFWWNPKMAILYHQSIQSIHMIPILFMNISWWISKSCVNVHWYTLFNIFHRAPYSRYSTVKSLLNLSFNVTNTQEVGIKYLPTTINRTEYCCDN